MIDCTGDACAGDVVEWTETVFGGSLTRPAPVGRRTIRARILKDGYGAKNQQHTFTLRVVLAEGYQPPEPGARLFRKARNVYKDGCTREPWPDEAARLLVLDEKHRRGMNARAVRGVRRAIWEG